jgi:hypothetical protein
MRLLSIAAVLAIMISSCRVNYYALKLNDDTFRLHPGEHIEKVKMVLSKYNYQYGNQEPDRETLQYFCTKCGLKVHLITLHFLNGQLEKIENREVDSIF